MVVSVIFICYVTSPAESILHGYLRGNFKFLLKFIRRLLLLLLLYWIFLHLDYTIHGTNFGLLNSYTISVLILPSYFTAR